MTAPRMRRVSLEYALSNGDVAVNVLHIRNDVVADFTEAEGTTIAALFDSFWDDLRPVIADNVSLQTITVRDASGLSAGSVDVAPTTPAGGLAADPLPFSIAACVSLKTALNSRSGRGRVYLVGFTETANTSAGLIVSTTRTTITTAFSNLVAALGAADYELGVYSRTLTQFNPVTQISIDGRWDVQRRRNNA